MSLPVMDGLAVLERLRADPATARTPVILLTAMSDRDLLARAAELGITDCLLKSRFTIKDLLARVAATLDAARAA
jgi:CheY-like chemotaxis protein